MSHFAKRHYEAIANALQRARPVSPPEAVEQWDCCVSELADTFAQDNPKFQRGRFVAACVPGADVRARTAHLKDDTTTISDMSKSGSSRGLIARLDKRRAERDVS